MATQKATTKKKVQSKIAKTTMKRPTKPVATKTTTKKLTSVTKHPIQRAGHATTRPRDQQTHRYDPSVIEPKWQRRWEADRLFEIDLDDPRQKFYFLTMYPYPSGDLHIGHWYAMAPSDAAARYRRMQGYNVFFPMGFDAFGLPAENAAIRRGIHPYQWTVKNIERMRKQLRSMGAMFDWSKEVVTCLPDYYKWNQWFFLKFFEAGLTYKKMAPVDWCPKDQTVLAREQVIGEERVCERCGTPVVKRDLEQWFFRITQYADELLDFSKMEWPERVQVMQTNWIGRSEGAEIVFKTEQGDDIVCFSTRPDTLYGATFIVLAPEHPLVDKLTAPERKSEVDNHVAEARRKTDIDREAADKEKTGMFIGAFATHPLSGERMPIYIADYVLMGYGTGAIMGVPAHDARDWDFAKQYTLPIPVVIAPPDWDGMPLTEAYTGEGVMVNSDSFNGMPSVEGKQKVAQKLEEIGLGKPAVTYRLRDWLISRQRYWGTPIPVIYCDEHGIVPVPEKDLPVILPVDDSIKFNPQGQSPLLFNEEFLNTTCPICGRPARRETDTMDGFVDNSWYQYRYLSPHDANDPFDPRLGDKWLPVDQYTGGIEHATGHLLYTRFFTKAMRDVTHMTEDDEPMKRLFNQGTILAPIEKPGARAQKMSKSKGNVIAPDDLVAKYGADTVRAFLMFIGPWEQGGPWDDSGIDGVRKWINRVWSLVTENPKSKNPNAERANTEIADSPFAIRNSQIAIRRAVHQTIKRVGDDMDQFKHNTAIAAMMELTNTLSRARESSQVPAAVWSEALRTLVLMMAPITPHVAEELWQKLGGEYSVHQQAWPAYDAQVAAEETFTLIVQVNGKVRDRVQAPIGIDEARARELALATAGAQKYLNGKTPRQVIYVKDKLVNIVI